MAIRMFGGSARRLFSLIELKDNLMEKVHVEAIRGGMGGGVFLRTKPNCTGDETRRAGKGWHV